MKLAPVLAATLAFATLAATPADAQHGRDWRGDRHHGWYGHGHGYGHGYGYGRHYGWDRHRYYHHGWGPPCRWIWRHHRRMRVCW